MVTYDFSTHHYFPSSPFNCFQPQRLTQEVMISAYPNNHSVSHGKGKSVGWLGYTFTALLRYCPRLLGVSALIFKSFREVVLLLKERVFPFKMDHLAKKKNKKTVACENGGLVSYNQNYVISYLILLILHWNMQQLIFFIVEIIAQSFEMISVDTLKQLITLTVMLERTQMHLTVTLTSVLLYKKLDV